MSVSTGLYTLLIRPLQILFELIYTCSYYFTSNPGLAIIGLSLAMNLLVLPLYRRADAMQEDERRTEERLSKWVTHIKRTFRGDERTMMLQTYYRQNHYSPLHSLRSAVSLLLQIPFFIAAYNFLSGLSILDGESFGPIANLAEPDALLCIGGFTVNVLPVLMTVINIISSIIYTKGQPLKAKIQLYAMALFFLVFLYNSPSGLVFYWTLNNVFSLVKTICYKVKKPKVALSVVCVLVGCAVVGLAFWLRINKFWLQAKIAIILGGVLVLLPLIIYLIVRFVHVRPAKPHRAPSTKLFLLGGLLLAVLAGLLIPSALLKASPQEFVDVNCFYHPLWYIAYAFLIAAGLFCVWFGVFYWLASPKARVHFENALWCFSGVALIDYMFFGKNLGLISSDLIYGSGMTFSVTEVILDSLIILAAIAALLFVIKKWRKIVPPVLAVATIAMVCMSGINCFGIGQSIAEMDRSAESEDTAPHFALSTTGKNVVVIMLDRAIGTYIPSILEECPELREKLSGFTYYSNVISFGAYTNYATPALYGGYEYTPAEINAKNTQSLEEKQNEALKVLPDLFYNNGSDVTVFDPPYAGYMWTPDLSIYDDYPEMHAYNTNGYFSSSDTQESRIEKRKRNFFCYSATKMMPVLLQYVLYNGGSYNQCTALYTYQSVISSSEAIGLDASFMDSYLVLENMTSMTDLTENENGCLLLMCNNVTHEPAMLAEPEFEPAYEVDNTEYDLAHADRGEAGEHSVIIEDANQRIHYQTNVAALKQLCKWFDYLKECGVYDNTRIILVSDHGRNLGSLPELTLASERKSDTYDLETYLPLLMVKDFDSDGFTVSDEFMTNADVPTLAVDGVIENAVNPFTGNAIDNSEKTAHDQYIIVSSDWGVEGHTGNTFSPTAWISVHDSVWDIDNWELNEKTSLQPSFD